MQKILPTDPTVGVTITLTSNNGTVEALPTDQTVGFDDLSNKNDKLDRIITGVQESIMASIGGNIDIELERLVSKQATENLL